jgi:hypothetical protein
MTRHEVERILKALAQVPAQWRQHNDVSDGSFSIRHVIRTKIEGQFHCPLTALYYYATGQHLGVSQAHVAAERLGYDALAAYAVVQAADDNELFGDVRESLMTACGIVEKPTVEGPSETVVLGARGGR